MQARRLDENTVLLEQDGETIIVLYPKSMAPQEVSEACEQSAQRLERRAKLYRDFCAELTAGGLKL